MVAKQPCSEECGNTLLILQGKNMNILDREGLVYFVKKMKTYLRKYVRLSDTGKISYQNLPFSEDAIQKTKYIKKEHRYLARKAINYRCYGDGRYINHYISHDPVIKVPLNEAFRIFINNKELGKDDLTYWHPNRKKRKNLIEQQGEALICKQKDLLPNRVGTCNLCFKNIIGFDILLAHGADWRVTNAEYVGGVLFIYIETLNVNAHRLASPNLYIKMREKIFKVEHKGKTGIEDIQVVKEGNHLKLLSKKGQLKVKYYGHMEKNGARKHKYMGLKKISNGMAYLKTSLNIVKTKRRHTWTQPSLFYIRQGTIELIK